MDIVTEILLITSITKWTMQDVLCNTYSKVAIYSLLTTGLLYLLPFLYRSKWKVGMKWIIGALACIVVIVSIIYLPKGNCTQTAAALPPAVPPVADTSSTSKPPVVTTPPKQNEQKKAIVKTEQPKPVSKFDIKDNHFDGPTQIGDGNTQYNQFGPKQREANDSVLNIIIAKVPDKSTTIWIYGRNNEDETIKYSTSIINALKAKGYANATMGFGTVSPADPIIVDDAEATLRAKKRFQFANNGDIIEVFIPLR